MVTLPSSLPILRLPGREVTHYSEEWVAAAVRAAAERVGNPHLWFADDVAAGVFAHLRSATRGSTVTLKQIRAKIILALSTVGLDDIASALILPALAYHVQVDRIASLRPFELQFFHALRGEVEPAFLSGAPLVICSGLEDAAMTMTGRSKWNRQCEKMRLEIVDFVSDALVSIAPSLPHQPPSVSFFQDLPTTLKVEE